MSFKEFLEDYEKKEIEEREKFLKRLEEGKVSSDEIYPPKSRFFELKEPIAVKPANFPVWSVVPFYGSTLIPLIPSGNRSSFDERYNNFGFSSRDINEMIDLVKNTGRIQFMISSRPTFYKDLDFLEPLFTELKPPTGAPIVPQTLEILIGKRKFKEHFIEFTTLAEFGFEEYIASFYRNNPGLSVDYIDRRLSDYVFDYIVLKSLGYDELVDEIEYLMITNPPEATKWFFLFGNMIAVPSLNILKVIHNFSKEMLTEGYKLGKDYGIKPQTQIPCDMGKFILEKLVRYPETLKGCWDIIDIYDDNELYIVLNALNKGVKERKNDIIEDKRSNMTEILDNVWEETGKIKWNADIARLSIGLIGVLSTNFSGIGILSGLGFSAADKIVGLKLDSVGEKIAKFFSPNYLVTIYDFKKKYNIQK